MQHDHGSSTATYASRRRLAAVLAITVAILLVEIVGGFLADSLALFADAGHMAADAAGIGLSLFAVSVANRPATLARTFGYQRAEILAAVANAVLLFAIGGVILTEGIRRLIAPPDVSSTLMVGFGVAAIIGNAASLALLASAQHTSLNVRGAFLEVLSDTLGAAAVVVAAIVIALTGLQRADAIASLFVGLLILPRTWRLLREAVDVLLEAAPKGVDLASVRQHMCGVEGVVDVHDLHAWTITSGLPVLSAHVVVESEGESGRVLDSLCACLAEHFDMEHCTFQLEPVSHRAHERGAHA